MKQAERPRHWMFWLGLAALLGYWYYVHPLGFSRFYVEDLCQETSFTRQLMAENLQRFGGPNFTSTSVMAPAGVSMPFMPWGMEATWLGAKVWQWNRSFPFEWAYYGLSLLVSYLGVGWILIRMKLRPAAAWGLAALTVVFNIPRHYKSWHHFEHMLQHWIYLSVFLDAWIWQRFWRERRWSWTLELWRGVCLLGMFGTAGYYWGALLIEWALVRGSMLWLWRRGHRPVAVEGSVAQALLPASLGAALFALDLRWFLPWVREVRKFGSVVQPLTDGLHLGYVWRPLWLDSVARAWMPEYIPQFDQPETPGTIGWVYWIPLLLAFRLMLRDRGKGQGTRPARPFVLLLFVALLYACTPKPNLFQIAVQKVVPFMSFFRVKSRWSIFLPSTATAILALYATELTLWYGRNRARLRPWLALFLISSVAEFSWLLAPVTLQAPAPASLVKILDQIRAAPGDSVLDLPFCVAGGNGYCIDEQCPQFPRSTVGQCLRAWHDKKVYGLYESRGSDALCEIYHREPYLAWFSAWREQRCFTPSDWDGFCSYLDAHHEISAILVYPALWTGAADPACAAQFAAHLGQPLAESVASTEGNRGGTWRDSTPVVWYSPRCAAHPAPTNH